MNLLPCMRTFVHHGKLKNPSFYLFIDKTMGFVYELENMWSAETASLLSGCHCLNSHHHACPPSMFGRG